MNSPTTNAGFLLGVFGPLPHDERPWVTAFTDNPMTAPGSAWSGFPPAMGVDGPGMNWYCTQTTYRGPRSSANAVRAFGVMLDDIGTKCPWPTLPPSYAVETSRGNFQLGYLFAEPVSDLAPVEALQRALGAAGFSDPGAGGPSTRYGRLPFGLNTKHAPPFVCRLAVWTPELRYSPEQIAEGFGVSLEQRALATAPEDGGEAWSDLPEAKRFQVLVDVRSALQTIPADERGTWVAVGQACVGMGDDGRRLWVEWSRTSPKYRDGDEATFDTFSGERTSYASIFARATKLGWQNPARRTFDPAATFGLTEPPMAPVSLAVPVAPVRLDVLPEDTINGARAFLQLHFDHADRPRLLFWRGSSYAWDGAAWCEVSDDDIRAQLWHFLDRRGASHYRPSHSRVTALLEALRAVAHVPSAVEVSTWLPGAPSDSPSPVELIPAANGLLHLPTGTLRAPSPRLFNLHASPVAYLPDGPIPTTWLQFLDQLFPGDFESVAALQEVFGYFLTHNTGQQKIFLLIGPPRCGKGVIGRVLNGLLGPGSVAGPTLGSLSSQFGLAPLVGKLLALVSDARLSGRVDSAAVAENLLRISGEDSITIDRKNRDALTMRLGVRFLLMSNELPRIADASGAMAKRFLTLQIGQTFYGREDPGLTARLLTELPGILNWAVEGWRQLKARGYFVPPKSSEQATQDLADLGSPIAAFVRDACTQGPHLEVPIDSLYSQWRVWCGSQGIDRPGTRQQFGRDMGAAFPALQVVQPRTGSGRLRTYRGLALNPGTHGTHWHATPPIAGQTLPPAIPTLPLFLQGGV